MQDNLSIPVEIVTQITAAIEADAAIKALLLTTQKANTDNPDIPFDPNDLGYSPKIKEAITQAYASALAIYPSLSLRDFHAIFLDIRLRLQ